MEASDSTEEGYCHLCYAHVTHQYERILHEGEYGTGDSTPSWGAFCMICYDSEAYINFYCDVRPQHLSTYEREYLDRLEDLYTQLKEYRNRV